MQRFRGVLRMPNGPVQRFAIISESSVEGFSHTESEEKALISDNHFCHVRGAKCHAARKKKPNSCPALEGQVHLSGENEYVCALGKIFEAGGKRSLAQRGNQAKFFHHMPGVQRSPIAYNLQHLREYNSCRIWASQSRRPPYVADVEGRARVEGVAASIHESYMDAHGNKVAEDAVFKSP